MYFTIYFTTSYSQCTLLFSMVKYIAIVFIKQAWNWQAFFFGILDFIHSKIHIWRTIYAFKTVGFSQNALRNEDKNVSIDRRIKETIDQDTFS